MRGVIGGIVLIGVVVMLYFGRTSWMTGGGVIMPQLTAEVKKDHVGIRWLVLTNTGNEKLVNLAGSVTRWNLDNRTPLCKELRPQQEVSIPLAGELDKEQIFVFAKGYFLPASFMLKPADEIVVDQVK